MLQISADAAEASTACQALPPHVDDTCPNRAEADREAKTFSSRRIAQNQQIAGGPTGLAVPKLTGLHSN